MSFRILLKSSQLKKRKPQNNCKNFFVFEDGEEFTDREKALKHQGRLSHITNTYTVYDENHEIIPFKLKPTCYDKAVYIKAKDSGQIDEGVYFIWKLYGLKFPLKDIKVTTKKKNGYQKKIKKERVELMMYSVSEIKHFYEQILTGIAYKFPKFGDYIKDPIHSAPFEEILTNELTHYAKETYNCYIFYGVFRICFVVNDGIGNEYVLKFSKKYDRYQKTRYDPCEIETMMYAKAKAAEVNHYFAEPIKLGSLEVLGTATCIMYAAKRYDLNMSTLLYYSGSFERYEVLDEEEYCVFADCFDDNEVAEAFLEAYKDDKGGLRDLYNFLCESGICDLHDENIGFDKNNAPVIIDYGMIL